MYTRHKQVFRRDARSRRPPAALRLLAIGAAMPRRRALPANARNAPRLPENLFATGILGAKPLTAPHRSRRFNRSFPGLSLRLV